MWFKGKNGSLYNCDHFKAVEIQNYDGMYMVAQAHMQPGDYALAAYVEGIGWLALLVGSQDECTNGMEQFTLALMGNMTLLKYERLLS